VAYELLWGVQGQGQFFTVSMFSRMVAIMVMVVWFMLCQEDSQNPLYLNLNFLSDLGLVWEVLVLVLAELFPLVVLLKRSGFGSQWDQFTLQALLLFEVMVLVILE